MRYRQEEAVGSTRTTVRQAAALLGVSERTVARMVEQGMLPVGRDNTVLLDDVLRLGGLDTRHASRRFGIVAGVGLAVVLAGIGVALYLGGPDVPSYALGSVLALPIVIITGTWLHRHLPMGMQVAGAVLFAIFGIVAYVLWPNDGWWALGQLAVTPLVALGAERARFFERGAPPLMFPGDSFSGPLGPP
jgi:hypothetical protein